MYQGKGNGGEFLEATRGIFHLQVAKDKAYDS